MDLREEIEDFANKKNLVVGFCTPRIFSEQKLVIEQKKGMLKGFVSSDIQNDIEKRINPFLTMPDVKTIAVFAMGYDKKIVTKKDIDLSLRGRFSVGAVGYDYHVIFSEYFNELEALLKQKKRKISVLSFSDTGPMDDRYLALQAGVGYIGKNGMIHTKKMGGIVFLGYMFLNIPLLPSEKVDGDCGDCDICIKACPTGALDFPNFHVEKCISYITQKKGVLTKREMSAIGNSLYGCDICQKACPKNMSYFVSDAVEIETLMPKLSEILSMTNSDFHEKIGQTAAGWRGKKIIQRNALVTLGNSKNKDAIPLIELSLNDMRPLMRETAILALENLKKLEFKERI